MEAVSLSSAQERLGELVDEVERNGEVVDLTRDGQRRAVLLSADKYDYLIDRLHKAAAQWRAQEVATGPTSDLAI